MFYREVETPERAVWRVALFTDTPQARRRLSGDCPDCPDCAVSVSPHSACHNTARVSRVPTLKVAKVTAIVSGEW